SREEGSEADRPCLDGRSGDRKPEEQPLNINIVRLAPVKNELAGIRKALERIAEAYEMDLAETKGLHVRPAKADTSGPEPEVLYSDDEMEWMRERLENSGKMTPELRRYFDGEDENVPS